MPEEFSLGWTEIDVAVQRSGLPAAWHPFEIRSAGRTMTEHRRLAEQAWQSLRSRGLADAEKLDPDVADTLRAWTRPEVLIMVRALEVPENSVRYRACIGDGLGVFSEEVDGGVHFRQIRPERLVETVLSMFPDYLPLPVPPIAIAQAAPSRAQTASDHSDLDFTSDAPTVSRRDKATLAEYSRWPLHRFCTVDLALRPRNSTLNALPTVTVVDTDGGRYLIFSEPLRDGGFRRQFTPSNGSHLRKWLFETISDGVR
ncbi:ESX secretion-associated protein EspG [Amycolatopsis jiangsuensis]|uniref:ESAT-6 protein secretion system EspG family protein n=1 Tax=Amycolatopsis jiangsuensis TaxID=1181879 RepID=A0A840J3L6_9PSEU|nr:ESX secretion-associated protein EspG [Amycolatopsis jiangsuensis]MBB4687998.1 hypothetical protein [Amycolatopsis jiangsuensis]